MSECNHKFFCFKERIREDKKMNTNDFQFQDTMTVKQKNKRNARMGYLLDKDFDEDESVLLPIVIPEIIKDLEQSYHE